MSKFIEMARRHGFGLEDITEDLTGEKPVEATEPDTSVKDAADLAAAAKEGAEAKPEGGTTVATGEAEEQTPEVASTDADLKDEKPVEATTDTTDKTDDITDVDNSVASNDAATVEAAAVVSVENEEDKATEKSKEAITDEDIAEAKKKLKDAGDILDKFIESKTEKASTESATDDLTVSNEGVGGYVAGFIAHALLVSGATAVLGPVVGSGLGNAAVAEGAAAMLDKKRKELEALTKEAKKLAISKGTELVKDGKIDKKELKKRVGDVNPRDLVVPAIWGFFLGPFVTAGISSELQDIGKKIREKTKEIEEVATALAEKAEKASTEEHSGDLEGDAAAAPLEKNNTSDEAGVIPQNADAEMISEKEDMEHAGKELDEAVEAVEVLEKTSASVESHYEVVKHCAARRGIDRHHVLSIGISLEHVLSDFGIDATKVVPSLESFGLEEEKKKSTAKLAERLKAILRSVMKALASAYRFVIDKVEKFAVQAKNFSPVLKKQLEVTEKALDAVKGDIVTVNVSEKVRKKLYIGKDGTIDIKAITDSDTLTVINDLILDGKHMAGADKEIGDSIKMSLSGSPKDAIKALKAVSRDVKNNFNLRLSTNVSPKVPAGFNVPDGHEVASITAELPGGKVLVNMFPKKEDGELDYTKGVLGFRDARDGGDDISGSIEAVNVSKPNLKQLLKSVNSIVGRGSDLATARVETIRIYKAIVKALEGFAVPDSKTSDATAEEIEELKNLYNETLALSRANVKYATGNIDGGIKYVFSSLAPAVRELVQSAVAPASKDDKKDAE